MNAYVVQVVRAGDVKAGMRLATKASRGGVVSKKEVVKGVEVVRGCPGKVHIRTDNGTGCYEGFAPVALAIEATVPALVGDREYEDVMEELMMFDVDGVERLS